MILRRRNGSVLGLNRNRISENTLLTLENFVEKRDFSGALAFLNFSKDTDLSDVRHLLWKGYSAFHLGSFEEAQEFFIELLSGEHEVVPDEVVLYLACVYYYLHMYSEAAEAAQDGPDCSLKYRILYHVAQKRRDEKSALAHRQKMREGREDQLSYAAMMYLRRQFQDAADIYKRLLVEDRENLALNLYVAMCYFKMDYYDVSLEILSVYIQANPKSIAAINLKACNHFRLYNGSAALDELKVIDNLEKTLMKNDLLRHNMVVFTGGQRALQVLPPLIDFIPEARLNLAIYFLRNDDIEDARDLLDSTEPVTPHEFILKAVIFTLLGQKDKNSSFLRKAQSLFQGVGTSPNETDTIPGRQCMASCFFLLKQFEDANVYLGSIKSYMSDDDDFNWNYGISLASGGDYKSAEAILLLIKNNSYRKELCYRTWLARCFIMNGKPENAWKIHTEKEKEKSDTKSDSLHLLKLIANEFYVMGYFIFAAKAFSTLQEIDVNTKTNEGKIGSCVGVFQQIIAGRQCKSSNCNSLDEEKLSEVILILKRSKDDPRSGKILTAISSWARREGLRL